MKFEVIVECDKCRKTEKVDVHFDGDGCYNIPEESLTIKGWHIVDNDESKTAYNLCSECYGELMANVNNLFRSFMESKI